MTDDRNILLGKITNIVGEAGRIGYCEAARKILAVIEEGQGHLFRLESPKAKRNPSERIQCLIVLAELTKPYGEMCIPFTPIMNATQLPRETVRRHVRNLDRDGYAEYFQLVWRDDGTPADSGYCITRAGREYLMEKGYR